MATPAAAPPRSTTNKTLPHPLNAWYVAAWDHELTPKDVIARTVAGRPVALYRTEDGRAVALADACWHRLAPLSMGKRVGRDEIRCPYHGLIFDAAGRCTYMPAQKTINPSATVPSFPIVERDRFVWIWVGNPQLADERLVPDLHEVDCDGWAGDGGVMDVEANFQLMLDNLMDLTHEEFLHASSIGQPELSEAQFEVTHDESTVTLSRWMIGIDAPPFLLTNLRDKFPGYSGKVDRWQIIRFQAPSTVTIDVGVAKTGTGAPEGDRSQGFTGRVVHVITPSTDRSSRYFWAFMRDYALTSQLITTRTREANRRVFGEDEAMLAAQQKAIDANPDYEFYSLNIDAGGMWIRQLTERMLAAEASLSVVSQ